MITYSRLGSNGGLGNQLFQIAATVGAAVKNGQSYQFPRWQYQPFFKHKLPLLTAHMLVPVREIAFTYQPISVFSGRNYDMQGYFQSEQYFLHCQNLIRDIFTFSIEEKHIDKVSVHVRRGDYLKMPQHHPVLPMSYYSRAMDMFKGAKFLVFSDDIEWCKQQEWGGHDVSFSDNRKDIYDLYDMSVCSHVIMANSSFSWWAAWLNTRPNRQVIAPKQWFGPALRHDTKDLIPATWKRI